MVCDIYFGFFGDVAQLVRACGSYPQSPGFKSLRRYQSIQWPVFMVIPMGTGFLVPVIVYLYTNCLHNMVRITMHLGQSKSGLDHINQHP